MGLKYAIEQKAFGGRRGVLGNVIIISKATTGAPTSAAPKGTLLYNTFDDDVYLCTDATGTWVKINA